MESFVFTIDDLKDLKYKITQKLVDEGLIEVNGNDDEEVDCENAIEEVFKEFVKFDYE